MKWWWLFAGVMVLGLDVGNREAVQGDEPKGQGWTTDYVAAKAAARIAGKPLLVVFR